MKKTLISGILAASMIACLSGCGGNKSSAANNVDDLNSGSKENESASTSKKDVTLKVWGAQTDQELLKELCEKFALEHPENNWTFDYGVVGEADAQARYLEDPAAAADVFSYPDDQITTLVQADALYEVTRDVEKIKKENTPGSVDAASYNGILYGYPMTADNGYYLYYDKSVLSQDDVKTLDGILEAANKKGKKVHMDVSNGWYLASFFIGNGCTLTLDESGKQVCDFNSEKGLEAAKAVREFCNNKAFVTGDDSVLQGGIGDNICCGISGPWASESIKEKLGDNFGAAKLPTFTCGGKQVQMGSFLGCKILGVNTQTKYPVEAMELARYLTNEESQARRFEVLGYGPSNNNVASSKEVASDPSLKALAEQSKFAISQHINGDFWTPAEAFGAELEAHSKGDLKKMLDKLVEQVAGK